MSHIRQFLGQQMELTISEDQQCIGQLIDVGSDLLIMYSKQQFYYIPFVHVQQIKRNYQPTCDTLTAPDGAPLQIQPDPISYRKMLMTAKGHFVEVYVTGFKTLHGYLTSIMNNYFVFYSPVYKTVYISLDHLKWLVPYPVNVTPYSMNQQDLHVRHSSLPLSRTFEEQCKKLVGSMVVFDLGDDPDKVGLLTKVEAGRVELVNANCEPSYWNLRHLKTVHVL